MQALSLHVYDPWAHWGIEKTLPRTHKPRKKVPTPTTVVKLKVGSDPNNNPREETQVQSLGQEDPLEKGMVIYSSILAWRISWTEEPGGLQSKESQRVRHAWATNTFTFATRSRKPFLRLCIVFSKNSSTNLAALFSTPPKSMKKLRVHKRKDFPFLRIYYNIFFWRWTQGGWGWCYVKTAFIYRCFKGMSR